MLKDRLEQEFKDITDDDHATPARSKTTTPASVALYTLTEASAQLGIPVRRGGGRGGGDRGRGRGGAER